MSRTRYGFHVAPELYSPIDAGDGEANFDCTRSARIMHEFPLVEDVNAHLACAEISEPRASPIDKEVVGVSGEDGGPEETTKIAAIPSRFIQFGEFGQLVRKGVFCGELCVWSRQSGFLRHCLQRTIAVVECRLFTDLTQSCDIQVGLCHVGCQGGKSGGLKLELHEKRFCSRQFVQRRG